MFLFCKGNNYLLKSKEITSFFLKYAKFYY